MQQPYRETGLPAILDPRQEALQDPNFNPTLGGAMNNVVSGVGSLAQSLVGLPGRLVQDLQNPTQAGSDVSNLITGTGNSVNNLIGQPVKVQNGQIAGLQAPSAFEFAKNFYQNPVNAAGTVAALTGVAGLAKGAVTKAMGDTPPTLGLPVKPNLLQKMGNSIRNSQIKIRLPASLYGPEDEAAAQEALNTYVKGGTPEEVYAGMRPAVNSIQQQIGQHLHTNGIDVPTDEVVNSIMQDPKLQSFIRTDQITAPAAAAYVQSYVSRLYNSAKAQPVADATSGGPVTSESELAASPTTLVEKGINPDAQFAIPGNGTASIDPQAQVLSDMTPSMINTRDIMPLKTLANQDYGPVYNKILANTPLTQQDIATAAVRNALDSVITKYHPEVKDLTLAQHNIMNAVDSVENARDIAAPNVQILGTSIPGGMVRGIQGKVGGALQKAGSLPGTSNGMLPGIAKAGVLGDILASGNVPQPTQEANNQNGNINNNGAVNEANNQSHSVGSIPQTFTDIKPDPTTGQYNVINPYTSGIGISPQDYSNQYASLQAQAAQPQNQVFPNQGNIQAQISALQQKYQLSQQIEQPYQNTSKLNILASDAKQTIQQAPPNLFSLYPTIDALRAATDPKYAQLGEELGILEQQVPGLKPGDLYKKGQTKQTALQTLDFANKSLISSYNTLLNTFTGSPSVGSSVTPPQAVPVPTSQGLPAIPQTSFPMSGVGGMVHGTGGLNPMMQIQ